MTAKVAALAVAALFAASLAAAQPAGARIAVGAYIPGADLHPSRVDRLAHKLGTPPAIVGIYKDWGHAIFEGSQLRAFWRRDAMTMITLEPWGAPLRKIASGRYDGYVRRSARAARRWGKPVLLRFAHEMNGNWYPWSRSSPAVYKAAWRHLVRVFRRAGADNVRWVWTPYVDPGWNIPFTRWYPGNRWVDWVGLDGYNWGSSSVGWHSFRDLFASSYRTLKRISSAPMIFAEVGCGEAGGNKASWVSAAMNRVLPHMKRVRALVWWSKDDPRGDLRVDSSRGALLALRRALRTPTYGAGFRSLLTPRLP
jgi:hypothetical protein